LEALRLLVRGIFDRLGRGYGGMRDSNIRAMRAALAGGDSLFLFLRTDKLRSQLSATRRGAVASGRSELDYLREVVQTTRDEALPVSLIPLALFWRKGARTQRRFLNLFYGAPQRPSDTGKVLSFLWNYRNLAVRVGTPIDLTSFVAERPDEGIEPLATRLRRTILIFLRREEKPVAGAALRPLSQIEELVLADPEVRSIIDEVVESSGRRRERVESQARKHLAEIAANPSPSMLAVLDVIVSRLFGRLFERIEVRGLDGIAAAAKQHPLVLMPNHRSHFDYLLLSWLFYERHMVPPMVAAGVNLSFWPLGPIFRRAGGFFLRRTFDGDPLYTAIFRRYVQQLIKDGITQEFFVEGTRSRTGRTLQPRLGMLGMVLEAYARGVRRDVYLVPVAVSYERLVEERSMTDERRGARKTRESLLALLRARRVLKRRFGAVAIRFGAPMPLSEAIGGERAILADRSREPAARAARGAVTERVALEVCHRISALVSAGRSAAGAAALLATPARGVLRSEFGERVRAVVSLLERLEVPIAQSLRDDVERGDLETTLKLLEGDGLVRRRVDRGEELIHFEEDSRDVLDYYRSTVSPALALGGVLALSLRRPTERADAFREADEWLDLLRLDFLPPSGAERERALAAVLDLYLSQGWLEESAGSLRRSADGRRMLAFLEAQVRPILEAYGAAFDAVLELEGDASRGRMEKDALAAIRRHLLLGRALFAEAASPAALGNAIAVLVRDGILSAEGSLRNPEVSVRPGPRFGELKSWRARVAAAVATR
jgi:glycerol-3-phosphate O-acyltransferase